MVTLAAVTRMKSLRHPSSTVQIVPTWWLSLVRLPPRRVSIEWIERRRGGAGQGDGSVAREVEDLGLNVDLRDATKEKRELHEEKPHTREVNSGSEVEKRSVPLGRKEGKAREGKGRAGQGRAGQGREGKGREGKGREGQGREGQGRAGKGKGRQGKGREGKGREGKGREGKGRDRKGKGQEGKGQERTGKERKGKERKGKERKGKERKGKERKGEETGRDRVREAVGVAEGVALVVMAAARSNVGKHMALDDRCARSLCARTRRCCRSGRSGGIGLAES